MKPKDLKHPFSFAERRPLLQDGIFFVPDYFEEHHLYPFPSFAELFESEKPVHLEYCSGNGTWIAGRAEKHPECNWVALERDFERVRKIVSKARNYQLKNLFVVSGEALTFTKNYLKDGVLDHIYINFPDPWPKKKHARHRLVQAPFAHEMARVLKEGEAAMLVTDDVTYSEQMIEVMLGEGSWEAVYPEPHFVNAFEGYGSSFFEELWRGKGKSIRYMPWQKKTRSRGI